MSEDHPREPLSRRVMASDRRMIAVLLAIIYVSFAAAASFAVSDLNGLVSTLQTVTFFALAYTLVVLALNLQWGYAGLFNIGIAGFMAIGVYSMSILTIQFGVPYVVAAIVAVGITAAFGALIALPALRLRADYLAIVTLAFAEIVRRILRSQQFSEFTVAGVDIAFGGATGPKTPPDPLKFLLYRDPASLRPDPNVFGELYFSLFEPLGIEQATAESILYAVFLAGVVWLFYLLLSRLGHSPFGRVLKAIREDEAVARALGKDTRLFKIKAFALGSALMGTAAILWYLEQGGASPENFRPETTFFVFVALIIGGSGSNVGSIVGGIVFGAVLFQGPRLLQQLVGQWVDTGANPSTIFDAFSGLDSLLAYTIDSISSLRIVLLGVVLVYLIQRRPEGLVGDRKETASTVDLEDRTTGGEK